MKICIVGAGSIGGYLATRLTRSGNQVTVIVRGPNLAAIRQRGLRLLGPDSDEVVDPWLATDRLQEAGPQDLVILAMKAHQVDPVVPALPSVLRKDTVVVPMQNGVPWWYFQRHGGAYDGQVIRSVDPDGNIAASIDPACLIGCAVYPAAEIVEPGVIRVIEGNRFPIGELDGTTTPRALKLSATFEEAGLKSPILDNIRSEIWLKLWGNLTFNPISALTRATLDRICGEPSTRQLAASMMAEAQTIAGKLGITFRVPLEKRIAGAEKVGAHKTSMLQDIENGRVTEIEALVGAVLELARLTDTPAPHIEAVYACTRLLQRTVCVSTPVAAPAPVAVAM